MSNLYLFGSIAVIGLIGLFLLSSTASDSLTDSLTGQFVTGIHMGVPSKNVKLSKKLIDGKEVTQAIIIPDKPYTKEQCKAPMCWYEDKYVDAQDKIQITGTRDEKGVNMNMCHSENSLRTVRVRNENTCFMQKIYCKTDGTWATWQETVSCFGMKNTEAKQSSKIETKVETKPTKTELKPVTLHSQKKR